MIRKVSIFVLLTLTSGCAEEARTFCPLRDGVPVHKDGLGEGPVTQALKLGTPVTASRPGLLGPKGAIEIHGGPESGFVPEAELVACPVVGEPAWVLDDTARWAAPSGEARVAAPAGGPPAGWGFGAALVVARGLAGAAERAAVLEEGVPVAWIALGAIAASAPSPALVRERIIAAMKADDLSQARGTLEAAAGLPGMPADELAAITGALDGVVMGAILPPYPRAIAPAVQVSVPGPAWVVQPGLNLEGGETLELGAQVEVVEVRGDRAVIRPWRRSEGVVFQPVAFGALTSDALVNGFRLTTDCTTAPDRALTADCWPTRGAASQEPSGGQEVPLAALDGRAPDLDALLTRAAEHAASGARDQAMDALHAALAFGDLDEAQARRAYELTLDLGAWSLVPSAAEAREAAAHDAEASGAAPRPELQLFAGCAGDGDPERARWLPGLSLPLPEGQELSLSDGVCLAPSSSTLSCEPHKFDWMDDGDPSEAWIAENDRAFALEHEAWLAQAQAVTLSQRRLRAALGEPLLRLALPSGGGQDDALLLVFSWLGELAGNCGNVDEARRTDLQSMTLNLGSGTFALGSSGLVLWLTIPDEPRAWGAAVVQDAAEAQALLGLLQAPADPARFEQDGSAGPWLALPPPWDARVVEVGEVGDTCVIDECGC